MTHDFDTMMDWCRRCGRPYFEIVEADMAECDGLPGVVHQRFLKAQADAKSIFDPILKAITADGGSEHG